MKIMRIGVLSDIHSNIYALEAVLQHGGRYDVEHWVNLGDILYGPIEPKTTYDCLQALSVHSTIRGNEDREIYEASREDCLANETLNFVCRNLGDEPIAWMRSLPSYTIIHDQIYLCHGSPDDDVIYLLEEVSSGHPIVRDEQSIRTYLGSVSQSIILCGHTHIPRTVGLTSGTLIINPGSVGLPAYQDDIPMPHVMQTYSPHARYAILEISNDRIDVQQCRVTYDWEQAAKTAEANGRYDWGSALRTGRA